jgi:serine protease 16
LYFPQKLDHFDSHDSTTFPQLYYNNSEFYNSSRNNVVVFVGGDHSLNVSSLTSGAAYALAQSTQALLFSLEHRFFGDSFPVPTLDTANLEKYLTVPQVLADLARFISANVPSRANVMLVGGFWPGTLASWFRLKYPSLSNSSWASSAPVSVRADFSEYDSHVQKMIMNITGKETCAPDLQGLYANASLLLNGNSSQKEEFFSNYTMFNSTQNVTSILYILAQAVAALVECNGTSACNTRLKEVCASRPTLQTFAQQLEKILSLLDEDAESMDMLSYTDTNRSSTYADDRSWTWLRCNELGWFQTSAGFRSRDVNFSYFYGVCNELFQRSIGAMENVQFGGTEPASRNVVFSNGLTDPWSTLGVQHDAPGLERVAFVPTSKSHCFDFGGGPDQQSIIDQLREWAEGTYCKNGAHVGHSCHCSTSGFGGRNCADLKHEQSSFEAIALCAVIVTTVLLLIIGASVWLCGKTEDEDSGQVRARLMAMHTYT